MRRRAWGLLLVVPATLLALVVWQSPFRMFHPHLVLAGTPRRFAATIVRAGRADARGALWLDNVFVLSWLLVVPRLARQGLQRWSPDRRRRFGFWRHTPTLAVGAGALDLVQNAVSLWMVGRQRPPTLLTLVVSVAGWSSWPLYAAAVAGVLGLVVGPLLAPVVRPAMRSLFGVLDGFAGTHPASPRVPPAASQPAHPAGTAGTAGTAVIATATGTADPAEADGGERIGIAVSGGGIRAASVALGALRELDRELDDDRRANRTSLFRRARWLCAVSGGSYTAGGWRISRRPGGAIAPVPTTGRDGLFDAGGPWSESVRRRRRYLDNGTWSIAGGVLNVAVRSAAVLGGVLAATYLAGWVAGRFTRSRALHSWFPFEGPTLESRLGVGDLFPLRTVVPGTVWVCLGAAIALSGLRRAEPHRRHGVTRLATPLLLLGGAFLVATIAVPAALIEGPGLLRRVPVADGPDEGAALLGILCGLGIVGALIGLVVSRATGAWLRLGGVSLAVALVLFGGKVATVVANEQGGAWASWPVAPGVRIPVAIVAVVWLVVLDCIASHRLSLGGIHRKRLAATFALGDGDTAPLPPLPYSDEPLWDRYADADGPELIVVATAHSSTTSSSGVKGLAFTFRPQRVTLFDRTDGTSASVPMHAYPRGSWWDGFPRGWTVSRSMALTGGALTSAMGRQALGTTQALGTSQALLVALNLRLGAWVPNPRFAEWFADPATAPRVHLGYLLKELLGRYDPARDAFVHVADGGQREDLGLVELLRERPDVVCCIDASGDPPGSFRTLREAIRLAAVELDVEIDIDLSRLRGADGALPADCAGEGRITYPPALGGGSGRLLYGRYQLSDAAPADLFRFGAANPRFPGDIGAERFLTDDEHLQLVALGEHVGARIAGLFARVSA